MICVARPYGKGLSKPSSSEVRLILPQPPLAALADALISQGLRSWCDEQLVAPPACFAGGLRGTQPLDIAAGVGLMCEKGLDDHSHFSCAQADVATFYDSLSPVAIITYLLQWRVRSDLLLACVLHQLIMPLMLVFGDVLVGLGNRTRGSLTGSRVAGVLGHIVIVDVMRVASRLAAPLLLRGDGAEWGFASWIDNLYCLARCEANAVAAMRLFEEQLAARWRLALKDGSRTVMSCRGQPLPSEPPTGWKRGDFFDVLGHRLCPSAGDEADWREACRRLWRRYWGGAGGRRGKGLDWLSRWRDVCRCCWPVLACRAGRWCWGPGLAKRVDALQSKILVLLQGERRRAHEDINAFCLRRARRAKHDAWRSGLWSEAVARRICSWRDHVARDSAGRGSWAARAVAVRDAAWLAARRRQVGSASALAGRTETRRDGLGLVRVRGETSVGGAETYVDRQAAARRCDARRRRR